MANWGVSVFLGTPDVADRLSGYLADVAHHGGTQIFTSLHIPEVPLADAVAQLADLTRQAAAHGLQVVADI
ncbi:MAG: MupG family TIM beta-alpha barrel fold protein, partial [Mycobacterium leprae]